MDNNYFNINKQELENKSKNILAKLSDEEIKDKASKYKKNQIIGMSVIGGIALVAFTTFFCCLPLILEGESISGGLLVFCIIVSIVCVGFPFLLLYFTLRKSEKELAMIQIKKENIASILNGGMYQNQSLDSNFNITKEIKILASGWTSTKLLIDNDNQKFSIQKGNKVSKSYNFSDLINYEVYENGVSKVKGTAGKALIGGAFFGLGGLIVGSSMGKSIKEKCNQLKLIIRVNDISNPQIVITYIDNVDWDKSGFTYRNMKENLQEVCSVLEFMINSRTLEETAMSSNQNNQKSNKDQLLELKEMLNEGLITQEEYDQKKKQILGL